MILNIILMVVLVKILIDIFEAFRAKEGMVDIEPPALIQMKECDYAMNLISPYYDAENNLYNNDNNFMFYNFENIKKIANTPCHSNK
jgi:hypothetical protein